MGPQNRVNKPFTRRRKKKWPHKAAKRFKKDFQKSKSQQANPQAQYDRIGVSDLGIKDTSAITNHPWLDIPPMLETQNPTTPKNKIGTLRAISCRALSPNAQYLNSTVLKGVSWTCVMLLWKHILQVQNDSIAVFVTFASILQKEQGFRCHRPTTSSKTPEYLSHYLAPGAPNYRLENLLGNINFMEYSVYMNSVKIDCLTILDLENCSFNMQDFLLILKIRNLTALSLSNSVVDDNSLYYIASALKDKRLPNLSLLKLNRNSLITPKGLDQILAATTSHSALSLIVVDSIYKPDFFTSFIKRELNYTPIPGTRWNLQKNSEGVERFLKFPIGIQLQQIQKVFGTSILKPDISPKLKTSILWDFMILDKPDQNNSSSLLQHINSQRMKARKASIYHTSCLTLDRSRDVKPKIETKVPTKEEDSIFVKQKPTKKRVIIKRTKPKPNLSG